MLPGDLPVPAFGVPASLTLACDPLFPAAPLRPLAAAMVSGNRCGHVPTAPRFFTPPETHAPHPQILVRLQTAIEAYFADPSCLPSLNAANDSARRQRSERRESCLALLGTLIHYLDLVSLRVGLPQADGTFHGLSMAFLAERAGLGLRRAERACHDLVVAGLLAIHPRAETTVEGGYRGFPAIRRIPVALFKVFGLDRWLQRERGKTAKRQRRQQQQQESQRTTADAGRQELNLEAARRRAEQEAAAPAPVDLPPVNQSQRETARAALGSLLDRLRGRPPRE